MDIYVCFINIPPLLHKLKLVCVAFRILFLPTTTLWVRLNWERVISKVTQSFHVEGGLDFWRKKIPCLKLSTLYLDFYILLQKQKTGGRKRPSGPSFFVCMFYYIVCLSVHLSIHPSLSISHLWTSHVKAFILAIDIMYYSEISCAFLLLLLFRLQPRTLKQNAFEKFKDLSKKKAA